MSSNSEAFVRSESFSLTFLGTGTSYGVPVIGCQCDTCTSTDPRDKRMRHGALLRFGRRRLLVDTPPELRLQLLAEQVSAVDAVWFTHAHADHIHGIDDLRVFTALYGARVSAWMHKSVARQLRRRFPYIFDARARAPGGPFIPELDVYTFREGRPVEILDHVFLPLGVPHGQIRSYGFRVGGLGYVTDGKRLPRETLERLKGVDVLVLNALWFGDPHPTHFNIEEAVAAARAVGARTTYLTHLTHRVGHVDLCRRLPEGIKPAFDGLTLTVEDTRAESPPSPPSVALP